MCPGKVQLLFTQAKLECLIAVFLSNGNTSPNEVSYSGTRMRLREIVLSHNQDLKSNKSPQNWFFL